MRRVLKRYGLMVLLVLFLVFLLFSAYIGIQVVNGSTQLVTPNETNNVSKKFWKEYGIDYSEFCDAYKIEKIELTSTFDGHIIPADYIFANNAVKDNKTVVMVHGLGGNRMTNYPVAKMFLDEGYNVLTYDQRSTNENTAKRTTFGYWEKYDLIDCIDYVRTIAPKQTLGVWGTSFGGATASQAVGYADTEQEIDFMILDCPVSNMKWMVNHEMADMNIGIPAEYMTLCGDIFNQILLGFSYEDAEATKSMKRIHCPVLIINSKADTVTPYFMGKDIYDSIQNPDKTIWTVSDSEHTEMWLEHNEEYKEQVMKLLNEIENIKGE